MNDNYWEKNITLPKGYVFLICLILLALISAQINVIMLLCEMRSEQTRIHSELSDVRSVTEDIGKVFKATENNNK
jgi:hypothetical protein